MVRQLSYTKFENEILPELRNKLNRAESTEDVKKFFFQSIRNLFERILDEKSLIRFEDITLLPNKEPHFSFSKRFSSSDKFNALWKDSDFSNVMNRLAKSAVKRYKRLERNPEKTDLKIRM